MTNPSSDIKKLKTAGAFFSAYPPPPLNNKSHLETKQKTTNNVCHYGVCWSAREKKMRVIDVVEVDGICLWLTSFLSSVATSNFRATCRSAERLAVRHGPVCTKDAIYVEAVEAPDIGVPNLRPDESPHKKYPFSPSRSWEIPVTWYCHLHSPSRFCASARRLFRDREFVLALAAADGYHALKHAHHSFRSDRLVVLAAVAQNGNALYFADEDLKRDRDVVLALVTSCGWALKDAIQRDQRFRGDRDVVLAAVSRYGRALQWAHPHLQSDRDIVIAAVAQNHRALDFADEVLRNDPEVLAHCCCRPFLHHVNN